MVVAGRPTEEVSVSEGQPSSVTGTPASKAAGASRELPEVFYDLKVEGEQTSWMVLRAHLREALSEPYELVLEVASADLDASAAALLSKPVTLTMKRGDLAERRHGVVYRAAKVGVTGSRAVARVVVGPRLRALGQRTDARIFQDLSAVDIVKKVLSDDGVYAGAIDETLDRDCPVREYCVQYGETDLAFVTRLLESEGIAYAFTHPEGDEERLLLFDHVEGLDAVPTLDDAAAPVVTTGATYEVETVRDFERTQELAHTSVTLRDFDWTRPALDLTQAHPGSAGPRARYEYPAGLTFGGYSDPSYGEDDRSDQARLRFEAHDVTADRATARSTLIGLRPGAIIEIAGHADAGCDGRYLVVSVEHSGAAPDELLGLPDEGGVKDRYRNRFECVPADRPYRPERRTPRPRVFGMQTATVVGPDGEEIYTDEHGRIRVRFHWDRASRKERSSCWVRVMQTWAGSGWGTVFLPRVGMEVVVNFLEGDPDRPLVIGCVYNGENRPPYTLPDEKTKSTLKTRSTPSSDGFNELRFEDKAGAEEVFFHAQRDHNEVIERDHNETVKGTQSIAVGVDRNIDVDGAQNEHVVKDVTEKYDADQETTVGVNRFLTVRGEDDFKVDKDQRYSIGGAQEHYVGRGQTNTIVGDQTTKVTGKQTLKVGTGQKNTINGVQINEVTACAPS